MSAYLQPNFKGWGRFDKIKQVSDEDGFGHWLAGFTAAEGCFLAGVEISHTTRNGLVIRCGFSISLRADDAEIIKEIQRRLGGIGHTYFRIRSGPGKPSFIFEVKNKRHLLEVIVPFFEKYPLRAKKQKDFKTWAELVRLLNSGRQLTGLGFDKAVKLVDKLRKDREYVTVPFAGKGDKIELDLAIGHWLAGFIDGDGSLGIISTVHHFRCVLQVVLRADDRPILEAMRSMLSAGYISNYYYPNGNQKPYTNWSVVKASELFEIVIPLLERCPLRSKKRTDFEIWKRAVSILGSRQLWSPYTTGQYKELSCLKHELQEGRKYKLT